MARDLFHHQVKNALIKDGWTITDDPLYLKVGDVNMEVDLAAEKVFAAQREGVKIAIEVKSFLSKSKLYDYYEAEGQYNLYRLGLRRQFTEHKLYLAVEEEVYDTFFQKSLIQESVQANNMSILVFNHQTETIVTWVNH
jgi:hypothetical protein